MLATISNLAGLLSSVVLGVEAVDTTKANTTGTLTFGAGTGPRADFQPYIFWAYGLACFLLFLFTLLTIRQARGLEEKVDYLKERLRQAHTEAID